MLDYTAKLTRHAWKFTPEDLDRLRRVGFDDRAILQINLIASWFNYINRVADGLGVGRGQLDIPLRAEGRKRAVKGGPEIPWKGSVHGLSRPGADAGVAASL